MDSDYSPTNKRVGSDGDSKRVHPFFQNNQSKNNKRGFIFKTLKSKNSLSKTSSLVSLTEIKNEKRREEAFVPTRKISAVLSTEQLENITQTDVLNVQKKAPYWRAFGRSSCQSSDHLQYNSDWKEKSGKLEKSQKEREKQEKLLKYKAEKSEKLMREKAEKLEKQTGKDELKARMKQEKQLLKATEKKVKDAKSPGKDDKFVSLPVKKLSITVSKQKSSDDSNQSSSEPRVLSPILKDSERDYKKKDEKFSVKFSKLPVMKKKDDKDSMRSYRQRKRSMSLTIDDRVLHEVVGISKISLKTTELSDRELMKRSRALVMNQNLETIEAVREQLLKGNISTFKKHNFDTLLRSYSVHDLMPASSKIILIDEELAINSAFYALTHNGVSSAIIWSSTEHRYTGVLTISDFISYLLMPHRKDSSNIHEAERTIRSLKRAVKCTQNNLLSLPTNPDLFTAASCLLRSRLHRIPVMDNLTGEVTAIFTHRRLIKFIYFCDFYHPPSFRLPLRNLNIGTWESNGSEVFTVSSEAGLSEALALMMKHRISSVPVVDRSGRPKSLFAKIDVLKLVSDDLFSMLGLTMQQILDNKMCTELHMVSLSTSFYDTLALFASIGPRSVVVCDEGNGRIIGIISLSDITRFILKSQTSFEADSSSPNLTISCQL